MAESWLDKLLKTKVRTETGPLGLPVQVADSDIMGGDAAIGGAAFVPGNRPGSAPHELMHANVQQLENLVPGGVVAEALLSRLSDYGYGGQAAYRNPLERLAYGYQEEMDGKPDEGFQSSNSPAAVAGMPQGNSNMVVRNLLDALGSAAEWGGRRLGRK